MRDVFPLAAGILNLAGGRGGRNLQRQKGGILSVIIYCEPPPPLLCNTLSNAVLPPSPCGGKSLLKKKKIPNPGCFAGGRGMNGEPGPEHRCRSLTDAVLVQTRMLSAQVHYHLYYWQPNHKRTISSSSPFLLPETGPWCLTDRSS